MLLDRPDVGEKDVGEKAREKLEIAIVEQDLAQVQRLVQENPRIVSSKDDNSRNPLHIAATEGNVPISQILLNYNAAIDARDKWELTPLFLAIYEEPLVLDRVPIVRLLLENGADVDARNASGDTPLHRAAFGEDEVVKLLLEHGAEVNAVNDAGETPLHKAVQYPEYEVVQELLRHGGLKTVRNSHGLTPVQIAEARGWTRIVEIFHSTPV